MNSWAAPIEVEFKFALADRPGFLERLEPLVADRAPPVRQVDQYLAHPCREFGATDEALRLRHAGRQWHLTYKGPKSAHAAKTRAELDIPLADQAQSDELMQLLQLLGFRPVLQVIKHRETFALNWKPGPVTAAVDRVEGLGDFVELERVVPGSEVAAAQQSLAELARHLGLTDSIRASYLEMLMERLS